MKKVLLVVTLLFSIQSFSQLKNAKKYAKTITADDLKEHLQSEGIGTDIHYPIAPNFQLALNNHITNRYPISEKIHETTISLPISTATDLKAAEIVSESINHWLKYKN